MSSAYRRGGWIGSLILLVVLAAGVYFQQGIADYYKVSSFEPSAEIKSLAERSGMSDKGKFYFYAAHPELESAEDFNADCRRVEATNPILGCYISGLDKIHIYNITNPELDGIKEVTAAHEMLHAAYERLSDKEINELATLIEATYERVKTADLESRMEYYVRNNADSKIQELYAILPTEFADIGPELEQHYSKYFDDRQMVVALHDSYNQAFTQLDSEINAISSGLDARLSQIEQERAAIDAEIGTLNMKVERFNQRAASGQFASQQAFDFERRALESERQRLISRNGVLSGLIANYNRDIEKLGQLGQKRDQLTGSIDSLTELGN